jgi:hypothetical protein
VERARVARLQRGANGNGATAEEAVADLREAVRVVIEDGGSRPNCSARVISTSPDASGPGSTRGPAGEGSWTRRVRLHQGEGWPSPAKASRRAIPRLPVYAGQDFPKTSGRFSRTNRTPMPAQPSVSRLAANAGWPVGVCREGRRRPAHRVRPSPLCRRAGRPRCCRRGRVRTCDAGERQQACQHRMSGQGSLAGVGNRYSDRPGSPVSCSSSSS